MATKAPAIVNDPRFRAGHKLITSGRVAEGAINIFASLLEEARTKHGETSIETAPIYYEYGNALFRNAQKELDEEEPAKDGGEEDKEEENEEEVDQKPAAVEKDNNAKGDEEDEKEPESDEQEENGDVLLALEMMETSYSIMETYLDSNEASKTYQDWVTEIQLPRNLAGIGDVLSFLGRHPDAADAYTRSLEYCETKLEQYRSNTGDEQTVGLEQLKDYRKAVEANILVAEELLACPEGEDVITKETQSCLVKAAERIEYITGYYDKCRDLLQDTVFLMGKLAATLGDSKEFLEEKENVCYASVMMMGVGERLAVLDEQKEQEKAIEPAKKKAKR